MKKSLTYLPDEKQKDLKMITNLIREFLPDECEMVILYGSYARGDYVDYDQRVEYGVPTYFMSDYDLLVVTKNRFNSPIIGNIMERVKNEYFKRKGESRRAFTTSIEIITESIGDLNKALDKCRYFYTDIKKEGILLYNSGNFELSNPGKLNYKEIYELASDYYVKNYNRGVIFIDHALFDIMKNRTNIASFMLHQACENFYRAILLTFTLYTHKYHDLERLSSLAKSYTLDVSKPFPRDTPEEQALFQLLIDSYVQARYNSDFVVSPTDIELLLPKVELLKSITKEACEAKLELYRSEL